MWRQDNSCSTYSVSFLFFWACVRTCYFIELYVIVFLFFAHSLTFEHHTFFNFYTLSFLSCRYWSVFYYLLRRKGWIRYVGSLVSMFALILCLVFFFFAHSLGLKHHNIYNFYPFSFLSNVYLNVLIIILAKRKGKLIILTKFLNCYKVLTIIFFII